MRKIPSVFERDWAGDRQALNEVTPGCEWVLAGEGYATAKLDGTACAIFGGKYYKRFDAKKCKEAPPGFIEAQPRDEDHWLGWVPVGVGPEDRYHLEALKNSTLGHSLNLPEGTYELVGPKVQGGNERWAKVHQIIPHGMHRVLEGDRTPERTFEGIRRALEAQNIEGIVYYHPDGRMAKVKRKDFGLLWPLP